MARGTGSQRRYSFDDLIALRVAHSLRDAGISLQALRRVAAQVRQRTSHPSSANTLLATDGSDVYEVRTDEGLGMGRTKQPSFAQQRVREHLEVNERGT